VVQGRTGGVGGAGVHGVQSVERVEFSRSVGPLGPGPYVINSDVLYIYALYIYILIISYGRWCPTKCHPPLASAIQNYNWTTHVPSSSKP
jgi:hypothetical protein